MSVLNCASCGTKINESDAYFGAKGQVCVTCHSQDASMDSAQFREAADPENFMPRSAEPDGALHHTFEPDAHGTTRTVSIHAGPLGLIIKLFLALYHRLKGRPTAD
ncbi:MAG: hypothetical protein ACI8RZ_000524 [Myxococcota bacterium]|jgi:hypothetical protein